MCESEHATEIVHHLCGLFMNTKLAAYLIVLSAAVALWVVLQHAENATRSQLTAEKQIRDDARFTRSYVAKILSRPDHS